MQKVVNIKPIDLINNIPEIERKDLLHVKAIFDEQGLPIGTIVYKYENSIRPFLYIEKIEVRDGYTKQGVMTALMENLKEEIMKKKLVAFLADVSNVKDLYTKLGWYNFGENYYSYGYGANPTEEQILEMRRLVIERDNKVGHNFFLLKQKS